MGSLREEEPSAQLRRLLPAGRDGRHKINLKNGFKPTNNCVNGCTVRGEALRPAAPRVQQRRLLPAGRDDRLKKIEKNVLYQQKLNHDGA